MKTHQSRQGHDSLQTALRSAFCLDSRRLMVLAALVLAMLQARSVMLYTLKNHVQLPGTRAVRYQRLLRFIQFQLPDGVFTRFALSFQPAGKVDLILDRTNWKLGRQDVNILLLSAVWNGFALPLMWTLLPHGGSSSQVIRNALLERFLLVCPVERIGGLPADREFIGKDWFTFLDQHGIAPCIRLPARATLGSAHFPVWAAFKSLKPGEVRFYHRAIKIYDVSLRVAATKNAVGETLYLAYRGRAIHNLSRYAQRWQTENLHAALKTRGFNLEDTGLTRAERVSTLLSVVAIAFIWACVTGMVQAAKQLIPLKKHGHRAVSVFRLGLDQLQDLLAHPSPASWHELAALMVCFEE